MKFLKYTFVTVLSLLLICCKTNSSSEKTVDSISAKFNYLPKAPVSGTLKGVVELGNTGYNYFIIEIDTLSNWKLKHLEYGKSLIAEGMTTAEEIEGKLDSFIKEIESIGVSKEHISFVVSSGAIKEEETNLFVEELRKKDHEIKVVTPKEEGIYALKSVLPKKFAKESFIVDLGSGNTKVSYIKDNDTIVLETHGSKYHQRGTEDQQVFDDVKKIVASIPKENTKYCFFIGGVPAQLASGLRKNNERYTLLFTDGKKFDKIAAEKGKKVQSGLNIYKALVEGTDCNTLIFDWESNFTIGYLVDKTTKS